MPRSPSPPWSTDRRPTRRSRRRPRLSRRAGEAVSEDARPRGREVHIVEFMDPGCEACRAFHPFVEEVAGREAAGRVRGAAQPARLRGRGGAGARRTRPRGGRPAGQRRPGPALLCPAAARRPCRWRPHARIARTIRPRSREQCGATRTCRASARRRCMPHTALFGVCGLFGMRLILFAVRAVRPDGGLPDRLLGFAAPPSGARARAFAVTQTRRPGSHRAVGASAPASVSRCCASAAAPSPRSIVS